MILILYHYFWVNYDIDMEYTMKIKNESKPTLLDPLQQQKYINLSGYPAYLHMDDNLLPGDSGLWNITFPHNYTLQPFQLQLSMDLGKEMIFMIKLLIYAAEKHNLTYFPFFGSLLGVYRHHGMIPWDGDADFVMDEEQKDDIYAALAKYVHPPYTLHRSSYKKWIIFNVETPSSLRFNTTRPFPFHYPFVEIWFFKVTNDTVKSDLFNGPYSEYFPLIRRPFWDMWMTVPRAFDKIVTRQFGSTICSSKPLWHSYHNKTSFTIKCDILKEYYPFVEHVTINDTFVEERLSLNGTAIYSLVLPGV